MGHDGVRGERRVLNQLEAVGHYCVRVENARKEMGEIIEQAKEMARRLRVVADCLDDECPERLVGFIGDRMFIVKGCREENQSARVFLEEQPHAKDVFEVPEGVRELMGRKHEANKLLFTHEEILRSSIRNYERNWIGDEGRL